MSDAEACACLGRPQRSWHPSSSWAAGGGEVLRADRKALAHAEKCHLPPQPGATPPALRAPEAACPYLEAEVALAGGLRRKQAQAQMSLRAAAQPFLF